MTAKLKVDNVSKDFTGRNGKLQALRDIRLDINEGEFLCIVGPSGCGKTTLLNIIAGLENVYKGRVVHNGEFVNSTGPDRLVIFQELGLFPWLSVVKNVEFGLKMKKVPQPRRRETALKYLDMVNLLKFKDAHIHELSGGMKQRVALARAFAMDPEVLLMDEPFTALDAQTRDMLHDELQKIWQETGKTIIFVTHNVREAVCLGDKVIVMSSQPGMIKTEFRIDLPRPRHIEDGGVMDMVRPILKELSFEIKKSFEEEYDAKKDN
jgi:NitT/TauT family transport system ATP-binding protein